MMKGKPRVALITSCSVTRSETPIVCVKDIPEGTMNEALDYWVQALAKASSKQSTLRTPGELYQGIAYDTITEIAQKIGRDNLYIVTGGQGLIKITDKIVPYDFTSDKAAEYNIHQKVKGEKFIPNYWWEQINTRLRDSGTPIADLLRKDPNVVVVGALTKGFIKYIITDLASIPKKDRIERVFIPVSRSMLTSFPRVVQECLLPYERSFTDDLHYTRYNKPHVATLKFLNTVLQGAEPDFQKVAEAIAGRATEEATSRILEQQVGGIDYGKMFSDHPDILKCETPQQAIRLVKVLGLRTGGKHRFAAAWRGAHGTITVEATKEEQSKAFKALKSVAAHNTKTTTITPQDELLRQCGLFVSQVREHYPDMVFNSGTVARWGEEMYGQDATSGITSAVKLAYILEYNASYLGIEPVTVSDKPHYRISKDNPDS